MKNELPTEIKNFIAKYIHTVSLLETLLLFYKHQEKSWTAEQVSSELRSNSKLANKGIDILFEAGFLDKKSDGAFFYEPASEELKTIVKMVAEAYKDRPIAVVTCIFDRQDYALRSFTDAFKVVKARK